MIIEDKDELELPGQIEYVAEEVIIEETVGGELYMVCESPNNSQQNSISDAEFREDSEIHEENVASESDHNVTVVEQITQTANTESDNPTEPIYLSDSMSCFDSDSDTQDTDIAKTSGDQSSMEMNDVSKPADSEDNDEIEALNESIDDVIIMPETDSIEIVQSDSDDERFASKFAFEPFVESDSQPPVDVPLCQTTKNGFKPELSDARLDETTTTDADDDMSEVEKRATRSRRDTAARKNYSYRRTYAKRKTKNDPETQQTNDPNNCITDDCSSADVKEGETEVMNAKVHLDNQTNQSNNEIKSTVQDGNTTDGTDEDSQSNSIRTKATRTHLRRSALLQSSRELAGSTETTTDVPNAAKLDADFRGETTGSSSNDVELSSDSKPEEKIAPRKRGRPRKKVFLPPGPNPQPNVICQALQNQQHTENAPDSNTKQDADVCLKQIEIDEPNQNVAIKTRTDFVSTIDVQDEDVIVSTLDPSVVQTEINTEIDAVGNNTVVVAENEMDVDMIEETTAEDTGMQQPQYDMENDRNHSESMIGKLIQNCVTICVMENLKFIFQKIKLNDFFTNLQLMKRWIHLWILCLVEIKPMNRTI